MQASAMARMHGDEATPNVIEVWCWCCCGVLLHPRKNSPLGRRGVQVEGQSRLRRLLLYTLSLRQGRLQKPPVIVEII